MHAPAAKVVTVEPDTVHTGGVVEVNDTGSPEDAEADKGTGSPTGTPDFTAAGCLKLIVCGFLPAVVTWSAGFTWNDSVALGAAA